jgi:hypothetical protein
MHEKRALERLTLAHQIQQQLLPKRAAAEKQSRCKRASTFPAGTSGGDYFDYMLFDDGVQGSSSVMFRAREFRGSLCRRPGIFYAQHSALRGLQRR